MATSKGSCWVSGSAVRHQPPQFNRVAAAWVAVLTVACCIAVVRAEIDGRCTRCGSWVKLSDQGAGLDTAWEGLCGACQDPKRRCDEVLKNLARQVSETRDRLGYCREQLRMAQSSPPMVQQFPPPIDWMENNIKTLEQELAALRDRLNRMRAECEGRGGDAARGGASAAARGFGTALGAALRDTLTGQGSTRVLRALLDKMAAERSERAAREGPNGGGMQPKSAPIEASHLDRLQRYVRPVVDSVGAPDLAASASEAMAKGPGRAPVASREDVTRPTLVDTSADLPETPVAKEFTLWQRHTTNALAYADSLQQSAEQIDAANAAEDPKRAHMHLERAVYLASAGQKELRQAVAERTGAFRELYKQSKAFEEHAKGEGKTVEEALGGWQAEVRANGLPAEYVAELQKAGLSEEQIAKRREWLQSADAKEAAQTHARFVGGVAPLYLPEARGKGEGTPLPEADDLWDLVTIQLLHTEHPATQPGAAKTGWRLLAIVGAAAAALLVVLVLVLRRRTAPSGA